MQQGAVKHIHGTTADAFDFIALTKPRVMSLVVFTAFAGIVIAPQPLHPFLAMVALIATAAASGGAAAFNMWYDRDIDAQMKRTQNRPIMRGVVTPEAVLMLAVMLSVGSVTLMALALNAMAAMMLALSIFYYTVIYTMWLKRVTTQNIVIGGAAGAFPPIIGFLAAAPYGITLYPILLFLIIFLWTPPHFWALALLRCDDYERAKVPMLPVLKGERHTLHWMMFYAILMCAASVLPFGMGLAGLFYGVSALVLAAGFLFYCGRLYKGASVRRLGQCFAYSVFYLFALFAAVMLDAMMRG